MERSGICPEIFCKKGSQCSQQKTRPWMVFRFLPCECRKRLKESMKQPTANGVAGHKPQTFTTCWKTPCLNWHQHKFATAQKILTGGTWMWEEQPHFSSNRWLHKVALATACRTWHGNSRRQNVSQENCATFSPGGHRANWCKIKSNW